MDRLVLVSLMAPSSDKLYRDLAAWLTGRGLKTEARLEPPWQERRELLRRGEAHAGVICGSHWIADEDSGEPSMEVIAGLVRSAPRYRNQPIYFSDLVVRRDHPARRWEDLRGAVLACNETSSHSGYAVVRERLARARETAAFFARALEAGSHQRSLELVCDGDADVAAIDSTVLDDVLRERPELFRRIHILEELGPFPAPPFVVSRQLEPSWRDALRSALLEMHEHPGGGAVLARHGLARFVAQEAAAYQAIRNLWRAADAVDLTLQALP